MYKVVYLDGKDIVSNSHRCPTFSRHDFDRKVASHIPCALLEYHEGVGGGATAIVKHRYQELLIALCQAPDYTQYSQSYIKRNPQLFCKICQRWQFERRRCALFVEGVQ